MAVMTLQNLAYPPGTDPETCAHCARLRQQLDSDTFIEHCQSAEAKDTIVAGLCPRLAWHSRFDVGQPGKQLWFPCML